MKFINYLESITGIGVYPLVSLLIFFLFFVGVAVYVALGRKEYFDTLSGLPLRSTTTDSQNPKIQGYDKTIE